MLLLLDPRDDIALAIDSSEQAYKEVMERIRSKAKTKISTEPLPYPPEKVMVYREEDFRELIAEFDQVASLISAFSRFAALDYRLSTIDYRLSTRP